MARIPLPKHGRDHRPGGHDPIPGLGASGIQFDTQPQAGQYLYVETDGAATTSDGWGMQFNDQSGNGIEFSTDYYFELDVRDFFAQVIHNFEVDTSAGSIILNATGQLQSTNSGGFIHAGGSFEVTSTANLTETAAAAAQLSAGTGLTLSAGTDVSLSAASGHKVDMGIASATTIEISGGAVEIRALLGSLGVGSLIYQAVRNVGDPTRWDHHWYDGEAGNELMSVSWNGAAWDYKIRTGAAWVASL